MELSVNSIVILVIAIVIMGLILGFIRSKFTEVGGNLVAKEPEPDQADNDFRMTLSREMVATIPGGQAFLKVNVFNPTSYTYTGGQPQVTCSGVTPKVVTSAKDIPAGTMASYIVTLSISKQQARSVSGLCKVGTTAGTGAAIVDPYISSCTLCGGGFPGCTPTCNLAICTAAVGCTCTSTTGSTCVLACPSGFTQVGAGAGPVRCTSNTLDALVSPKDFAIQIN